MNRITSLFGIQYPIIQGGMVWCSGWRLASAVSNAEDWDCLAQALCIRRLFVNISEAVRLQTVPLESIFP